MVTLALHQVLLDLQGEGKEEEGKGRVVGQDERVEIRFDPLTKSWIYHCMLEYEFYTSVEYYCCRSAG